jgi:tRNA-dihydrouridine synthase B
VRVARKHIQWYCHDHPGSEAFWARISAVDDAREQRARVAAFFADAPALAA